MKRKILFVLGVFMLILIWTQSILPPSGSSQESAWFTDSIVNPLLRLFGLSPLDSAFVRKLAHVAEFFLFSLLAALWWNDKAWKSLYTGFTAAFLDESIQILSGRGPLVTDIWIDLIGVALGCWLGCTLCGKSRGKKCR